MLDSSNKVTTTKELSFQCENQHYLQQESRMRQTMTTTNASSHLDNTPRCHKNTAKFHRLHDSDEDRCSHHESYSSSPSSESLGSLTSFASNASNMSSDSESENTMLFPAGSHCHPRIPTVVETGNPTSTESTTQPPLPQSQQFIPDPFPELADSPPVFISNLGVLGGSSRSDHSSSPDAIQDAGPDCSPFNSANANTISRRSQTEASFKPQKQVWGAGSWSKTMLVFYNEDQSRQTLTVDEMVKAGRASYMLVLKNQETEDKSWSVVEHLSKFNLERSLEDHESVLHVYRSWGHSEDNRFLLRKDPRKYGCFSQNVSFLDSGKVPEMEGYLQMRQGSKKSWKKRYFVLQPSGLYYSTKGTSRDPKHLKFVSRVTDVNVYHVASNAKKTLAAPNNNCFCLKPLYVANDVKDLKCFCAEDEASRTRWMGALRVLKYGPLLRENYEAACHREGKLRNFGNPPPQQHSLYRSPSVLSEPSGAASDHIEVHRKKQQQQRQLAGQRMVRSHSTWIHCYVRPGSPERTERFLCSEDDLQQPWFHNGVSREQAVQIISQFSLEDGVFLVRESHSIPDTYVLSIAHNHKVKHCQIHQFLVDNCWYYSVDNGTTLFGDLTYLLDFYQRNDSILPTKPTHYVPVQS